MALKQNKILKIFIHTVPTIYHISHMKIAIINPKYDNQQYMHNIIEDGLILGTTFVEIEYIY